VPLDVLSGGKEFALSVLKDDGYRLQGFSPSIDDIFENLEGRVSFLRLILYFVNFFLNECI
jgi:hypothetical protein